MYSLKNLTLYFLKLGVIGFGGPIALVGYMQKDLVEGRAWLSKEEYMRGLAFSQMMPGPLATQLAMYIGYIKASILGATLSGIALVLPSFLMVAGIGELYIRYGGAGWIEATFYGIGAAVIGIIAKSSYKLAKATLKKNILLWLIFIVMAVVTAYTKEEIVWLFVLCGFVAMLILAPPKFISPRVKVILPIGFIGSIGANTLAQIFLFFAKAGTFVFGSGLAIVPFMHYGVVQQHHWLNERQFLDAVAVAMITPGPVVITVGFIGYLIAGFGGAVMASLGVFLPAYLMVILAARYFERYGKIPQVVALIEGVTAAAVGAIAGAVVVLGQRAIIDVPTTFIAIATLLILIRFKIPEPAIVILAGIVGLLLFR